MKKILYIENEEIVQQLMRITIGEENILRFARSGAEALRILETESFDIIITGINLQDMDGRELIRKIRSRHSETRIIVLSVMADLQGEELRRLGVEEAYVKPMDIMRFATIVKEGPEKRLSA